MKRETLLWIMAFALAFSVVGWAVHWQLTDYDPDRRMVTDAY